MLFQCQPEGICLRSHNRPPSKMAFALSRNFTLAWPARESVKARATYNITVKNPQAKETTFQCASDQYILDAAEAAGLSIPNSCRAGTCCTCAGRIQSGEVDQSEQNFLDDQQMAEGYALLCVSYPQSDCTILSDVHALNPLMK